MQLKKRSNKKNLFGKICGVTLALAMTVNMMCGYVSLPANTVRDVKAATTAETGYYEEWKIGVSYKKGDLVAYQGKVYECVNDNTAIETWDPANVASLWKERTDLTISGIIEETTAETTTSQTSTGGNTPVVGGGKTKTMMIGYWHTWHNDGNPFIKLRDVDKNWDVINISFTEPVSPGSTDGRMKFEIAGLTADYTKEDFKQDVKDLQAQGKKIVLAIGGYEGYFQLGDETAVNQFVSDITSYVDEYGFDGIDIDLEQSSVNFVSGQDPDINNPKSPNLVNMITAIRTIMNRYDDDFILSWAPETFYVQMGYTYYAGINEYCDARAGSYLPMINALRDETTFVHVQLYNSIAITAPDGISYSMGTKEATVAMCKMLLDGFYVGAGVGVAKSESTFFKPLRPDQVVIGVPSSQSAAGSGQISNENLQAAFAELNSQYPGMRGIMSWSINWDASQNNNSFVRENKAFLAQYSATDEEETTNQEETTKTVETEAPTEEETTTMNNIVVSDDINVNGCQISATAEGMRTVYSVEKTINGKAVTEAGLVYSLSDYAAESELYVGSDSAYVQSYQATAQGVLSHNYSGSATATSYAMTMQFAKKTAEEYNAKWAVRAYAKLADGTYVYSKTATYTIFGIAEKLYNGGLMSNLYSHDYLYTDILKVVNPSYIEKQFDYNNMLV